MSIQVLLHGLETVIYNVWNAWTWS